MCSCLWPLQLALHREGQSGPVYSSSCSGVTLRKDAAGTTVATVLFWPVSSLSGQRPQASKADLALPQRSLILHYEKNPRLPWRALP